MGYFRQLGLPIAEPVSLAQAKAFLRLPVVPLPEDPMIQLLIRAARERGEIESNRCLAQRQWVQTLDSFPYYIDTIQNGNAFPPAYYSAPLYSTTLWNYSQMIKLSTGPVVSIDQMAYIDTNGNFDVLIENEDFVLDRNNEPARIFPYPGTYWPACLYVPNALQIIFTAGYDPQAAAIDTETLSPPESPPNEQPTSVLFTGVPQLAVWGIMNLVSYFYNNRGSDKDVPERLVQPFRNLAVWDFSPTRG